MKIRGLIACLVIVAGSTAVGNGQGRVTRYDVGALPMVEIGTSLRIKKVMGDIGTFMIGTFAAGWKNTPHHHTHEQINVGLTGTFNIVTPATPHEVSSMRGLIIPPDVMHGNDVTAQKESPLLIEFQPVRRVDFPPEREKVTFPRAAGPVTAPDSMDLDFRSGSSTWQRVNDLVRVNVKKGAGVAVSAWQVSAGAKDNFVLRAQIPGSEQFIYLHEGAVELMIGGEKHAAAAGTLLVIAANSPTAQVRGTGAASVLLVFEATKVQ